MSQIKVEKPARSAIQVTSELQGKKKLIVLEKSEKKEPILFFPSHTGNQPDSLSSTGSSGVLSGEHNFQAPKTTTVEIVGPTPTNYSESNERTPGNLEVIVPVSFSAGMNPTYRHNRSISSQEVSIPLETDLDSPPASATNASGFLKRKEMPSVQFSPAMTNSDSGRKPIGAKTTSDKMALHTRSYSNDPFNSIEVVSDISISSDSSIDGIFVMKQSSSPCLHGKVPIIPRPVYLEPRVYSPHEMLAFKEKIRPTSKKLESAGFIMLLTTIDEKLSSRGRQFPRSRSNNSQKGKPELVEHGDRFISSVYRKLTGNYDENSIEAKRQKVQIDLNRLNLRNAQSVLNKILEYNVEPEIIIELFLDRVAVDSANPEKNLQFKSFAQLASLLTIQDSNEERRKIFRRKLNEMSFEKLISLLYDPDALVTVIQGVIVWIAHLFNFWIIKRKQLFAVLQLVISTQTLIDRTIEIITAAFYTCGETIDQRKYYESSTFYSFLMRNPSKRAYVSFYVSELMRIRNNNWNVSISSPIPKPRVKKPAFNPQAIKMMDDVDIEQQMDEMFNQYVKNGDDTKIKPLKNALAESIINVSFKMLTKHISNAEDFIYWLSRFFTTLSTSEDKMSGLIRKCHSLYKNYVNENENGHYWTFLFMFYAALYDVQLIAFSLIFELLEAVKKSRFQPNLSTLIRKMGNFTTFVASEVNDILTANNIIDPNILAAFAQIVDSEFTPCNDPFIAALVVRDIVCSCTKNSSLNEALNKHVKSFHTNFEIAPKLVPIVACETFDYCDVSSKVKTAGKQYFANFWKNMMNK